MLFDLPQVWYDSLLLERWTIALQRVGRILGKPYGNVAIASRLSPHISVDDCTFHVDTCANRVASVESWTPTIAVGNVVES